MEKTTAEEYLKDNDYFDNSIWTDKEVADMMEQYAAVRVAEVLEEEVKQTKFITKNRKR